MKFLGIFFLFSTIVYGEVYYSKVEPYEIRDISSNVSGLVLFADEDLLGTKLSSKPYIHIDDQLDVQELKLLNEKINYLTNTIITNEEILKNIKHSLIKKRANYEKIKSLKIKSSIEKDREFHDLIISENLFLNTQKEILNLKVQVTDLNLRKSQLVRIISDKSLSAKNFILYSLKVKPGQVVSPSTLLAQVANTSKAKLTIFLDESDVNEAEKKEIYIDGKKTDYKISRIINIADSKNISKYMAQIIIDSPKIFSNLVKIELK